MEKLSEYIKKKFGVSNEKFLEVFKMSPGAEGYLLGSLGEQLFKEHAESIGYEVLRIKEKPEGGYNAKSDEARGDFYIRKKGSVQDEWLVIECKGVKSNSEKRANLTNRKSCLTLLRKHSVERRKHLDNIWKSGVGTYEKAKESWAEKNSPHKFPNFSWFKTNPGSGIPNLENVWANVDEIESWLNNFDDSFFTETAYWDLTAPIRLIQTHMPSSRIDKLGIKSTGPLVSEFNILCLDLFLRTGKHEFVFANSQQINHQAGSPNHLQQNYTIDILTAQENFKRHELLKPWYDSLEKCILETKPQPRKLDISQLDSR